MRLVRRVFVLPIRVYQRVLSPLTPPSCRFEPSCSEYGARAVLEHGVAKGALLGAWRVLRCHPFCAGGFDPVPAAGRWRPDGQPGAQGEAPRADAEGTEAPRGE